MTLPVSRREIFSIARISRSIRFTPGSEHGGKLIDGRKQPGDITFTGLWQMSGIIIIYIVVYSCFRPEIQAAAALEKDEGTGE